MCARTVALGGELLAQQTRSVASPAPHLPHCSLTPPFLTTVFDLPKVNVCCSNCELIGSLVSRFPQATTIEFHGSDDPSDYDDWWSHRNEWRWYKEGSELAAALAALPTGCWPAIRFISGEYLVPEAAVHLQRLCPRLTRCLHVAPSLTRSIAEELGALVPAAGIVEGLEVMVRSAFWKPVDTSRAGLALARLRDLRQLQLMLSDRTPACAAGLLQAALPSLTALSMLNVGCYRCVEPARLGASPESLQRLVIMSMTEAQLHKVLESAPSLAGITPLSLT